MRIPTASKTALAMAGATGGPLTTMGSALYGYWNPRGGAVEYYYSPSTQSLSVHAGDPVTAENTIVVFDWSLDSNDPQAGYDEGAADVLFAMLMQYRLLDADYVHLIGHSRGGVVSGEDGFFTTDHFAGDDVFLARFAVGQLVHHLEHGLFDDAPPLHLAHVLAEVTDHQATIDRDAAAVGLLLTDDQTENRGLARAIRADEADLFPAIDACGRVHEEDLLAVVLADGVEADHARG